MPTRRKHGVVILRPHDLQKHEVHFILMYDEPRQGCRTDAVPYTCHRVPQHMRATHWRQLQREAAEGQLITDKLLHVGSRGSATPGTVSHVVSAVLGKFEEPRYIHVYELPLVQEEEEAVRFEGTSAGGGGGGGSKRRPRGCRSSGRGQKRKKGSGVHSGWGGEDEDDTEEEEAEQDDRVLLIELPRYGLEFELCRGQLLSHDYSGYRLRDAAGAAGWCWRGWSRPLSIAPATCRTPCVVHSA